MPPAEAGLGIGNNGLDAGLKASSTRTARRNQFSADCEAMPLHLQKRTRV